MRTTKWLKLISAFAIITLALAACGAPSTAQPTAAPTQPTTAPAQTGGGKLEILS